MSTLVDSALLGRNEALSFFCTSDEPAREGAERPADEQPEQHDDAAAASADRPGPPASRAGVALDAGPAGRPVGAGPGSTSSRMPRTALRAPTGAGRRLGAWLS